MGNICVKFQNESLQCSEDAMHIHEVGHYNIKTDFVQNNRPAVQKNHRITENITRASKGKSGILLTPKLKEEILNQHKNSSIKSVSFKAKTLEDFEVIRGLGKGGFGKVFLIRLKESNERPVRPSRLIINLESVGLTKQTTEQPEILQIENISEQTQRRKVKSGNYLVLPQVLRQLQNSPAKTIRKSEKDSDNSQKDKENPKYFALKIISKTNIKSKRSKEQALSERLILESMDHPFIIKLHYAFQTKSRLFLIVDLLQGGELFFLLRKLGKFKQEVARFYAAQILLAIEYLHSRGIIYRDLKPENILLDSEGHIKVTDFGLSKVLLENQTKTFSFCGTAEYIAPEVVTGKGYGKEADWFSYGSLLYDMLTGSPPFPSKNRRHALKKLLTRTIPMPYFLSSQAKSLLTSLFKLNPAERLGRRGAEQIKNHSFFKGIDFDALYERTVKPPIEFKMQRKGDDILMINNNGFEKWNSWKANLQSLQNDKHLHGQFQGFTYGQISFQLEDEPESIESPVKDDI